jgi:hypothetical protein
LRSQARASATRAGSSGIEKLAFLFNRGRKGCLQV